MKPADIKFVVVHCSDSAFGDVALVDKWHRERGWSGIGYHYVITNGYAKSVRKYDLAQDGKLHVGRPTNRTGAHCLGYNGKSIGICLIGKGGKYTERQMSQLRAYVLHLCKAYKIPPSNVLGHGEADKRSGKKCPELDMADLRSFLTVALGNQ